MPLVSTKWWVLQLSNLRQYVVHLWKLTSMDFWISGNERKPLSKQKCVLRKCCGVSQKWWVLELSNLCHCVQDPWKLTFVGISGALWTKENHFSKQKFVLKKCCGVSQKWWMLEISNLIHCVQDPWKLTFVGISGALGTKEIQFLNKNMFWENVVGYIRNGEC